MAKIVLDRCGFKWTENGDVHLRKMDDPGKDYGDNDSAMCGMHIYKSDSREPLIRLGRIKIQQLRMCHKCMAKLEELEKTHTVVLCPPKVKVKVKKSRPKKESLKQPILPLGYGAKLLSQQDMGDG